MQGVVSLQWISCYSAREWSDLPARINETYLMVLIFPILCYFFYSLLFSLIHINLNNDPKNMILSPKYFFYFSLFYDTDFIFLYLDLIFFVTFAFYAIILIV